MPRKVNIPGVGTVNFPDEMPLDQIASESARLSGQHSQPTNSSQIDATRALGRFAPTIPAPPSALNDAVRDSDIPTTAPLVPGGAQIPASMERPMTTMASQVGDLAKGMLGQIPGVGLYQDTKNAIQHLQGNAPPEPPFLDRLTGAAGINRKDLAAAAEQRDIPQMVGETAIPVAQAVLLGKGLNEMRGGNPTIFARKTTPKQVEAATATFEPPTGKAIDPYEEVAKPALPELRNAAAKMGIDVDKAFKGREGNQLGVKIADEAIKSHDAEMAQITKPYSTQTVSMKPIADAIRAEITPEMRANEPKLAASIEAEAAKFDRDGTLGEVNQYRMRKNKELSSFYNKTIQGQVTSPLQVQAEEAGLNAARSVQYGKLADVSGVSEDYIRNLQRREGSLISYRNGIEKMANKLSPKQAEAVSTTMREHFAGAYPSSHGWMHSIMRSVFGLNPVDVMNARLRSAFSDLGAHEPPPSYNMQPPPIKGLLPAGNVSAPLPMGARQMNPMDSPGALIPAETRLKSDSITDGVYQNVSEPGLHDPQWLSGGAHPEMSGELRQPGTVLVDDPKVAERALARYKNYTKGAEYKALDSESRAQIDAMAKELERVAALGRAGKGTYSPGKLNQTFLNVKPPTPPSGTGPLKVAIGLDR